MYNEAKVPVYIMTIWKGAGKVNKKLANKNIFQLHILRQTSPFQMTEGRGTEGVGVGVGADLFFLKKWNSFHARLNHHYNAWICKKKKYKKIKAYRKSV